MLTSVLLTATEDYLLGASAGPLMAAGYFAATKIAAPMTSSPPRIE